MLSSQSHILGPQLTQYEKDALWKGLAIAFHSLCYWTKNLDLWRSELSSGILGMGGASAKGASVRMGLRIGANCIEDKIASNTGW